MNPTITTMFRQAGPGISNRASFQAANQPSADRSSKFEALRKQVQTPHNSAFDSSVAPAEILKENWKSNRVKLDQVAQRASALPQTKPLDSVRVRLADLDSQYQSLGHAIDGISGPVSPEQLLKLQKDMYRLSENIGLISKTIDQLTTGVKALLQTQI